MNDIELRIHDAKVRADVIDKCIKILNNTKHSKSMEMDEYIAEVTKQLEEQRNEKFDRS